MTAWCTCGAEMRSAGGRTVRGRTVEARWRCTRCRVLIAVTTRGVRILEEARHG